MKEVVYFYYYKVKYYIDADLYTEEGFTYGKNWNEVIEHLVDTYGEDEMVEIEHLKILGDGASVLEFEEINKNGIKVNKNDI